MCKPLKICMHTCLRTHPQADGPTCFALWKFPFPALDCAAKETLVCWKCRLISLPGGFQVQGLLIELKNNGVILSSAKTQDLLGCELRLVSTQLFDPGHEASLQCLVQGVLGLVLVGVHVGFHRLAGGLRVEHQFCFLLSLFN